LPTRWGLRIAGATRACLWQPRSLGLGLVMPLRFSRRLSIAPGLRVNLSTHGASLSVGHCGAWYTVGPRGQRVTVGAPGTGIFWTERVSQGHVFKPANLRVGSESPQQRASLRSNSMTEAA
jgi:hypothetical protein